MDMPDRYYYNPINGRTYAGTPDNPLYEVDILGGSGSPLAIHNSVLVNSEEGTILGPLSRTEPTSIYYYPAQNQFTFIKPQSFASLNARANEGWSQSVTFSGAVTLDNGDTHTVSGLMAGSLPADMRMIVNEGQVQGAPWDYVQRDPNVPLREWGVLPAGYRWATSEEVSLRLVASYLLTHSDTRRLVEDQLAIRGDNDLGSAVYSLAAQLLGNMTANAMLVAGWE